MNKPVANMVTGLFCRLLQNDMFCCRVRGQSAPLLQMSAVSCAFSVLHSSVCNISFAVALCC